MDNEQKIEGLTLGIVAMVFAFLMPIVTYICGGIGLSKANAQIKQFPNTPTTAKTLCILSIIITTILVVLLAILKARA